MPDLWPPVPHVPTGFPAPPGIKDSGLLPSPENCRRTNSRCGPAFSLCLHACLLAALWGASCRGEPPRPDIMTVSLVALHAPADRKPAAPVAPPESPRPQPEAVPTPPKPAAHAVKKADPPRERKKPVPPPAGEPARPAPDPHAAEGTPPARPGQEQAAAATGAPDPGHGSGGRIYTPNQLDKPPAVTRSVQPDYPADARSRRLEGRVVVKLVVEPTGRPGPCSVHAARPQGYFEQAALDAARRMRFSPGTKEGKAVRAVVLLPFDFQLR